MYRPTVRYNDRFKEFVDNVYEVTTLDRNQILRAALFVAAHTPAFRSLLNSHLSGDGIIPVPNWSVNDSQLWKCNTREETVDGCSQDKEVNGVERPADIPKEPIRVSGGGISFKLG